MNFWKLIGLEMAWIKSTYRIEQHHALVHNLQIVRHEIEIIVEFLNELADLWRVDFDDEWVWQFDVLGRDHQVVSLWNEHLDHVDAITKVMLARIQRLLFYYFVHELLILHLFIGSWVAFYFLVEGASRRTAFLLPYYEVWALMTVYEWILANIL